MNTPAHVVINLFALGQKPVGAATHPRAAAIVTGAVLPDLTMIVFYAWHRLKGTAESQIWSLEYYRPAWQAWFDAFNSIPIILLGMLLSWKTGRHLWLALFSSMLLHVLGDLPLHHDDAHRHFFPLSDWRFASPVSYWDPAHYGDWFGLFELCVVLGAATYLWRREIVLRPWAAATTAVYLAYLGYVLLVWA